MAGPSFIKFEDDMGYYLNPAECSKEEYLLHEGIQLGSPIWPKSDDVFLVCLIDNYVFSAAGICYDRHEMNAFVNDGTQRPRSWWFISKEKAYKGMYPGEADILKKKLGV